MSNPRARTGARGEKIAQAYLQEKGYQVVDTNVRSTWGEVDIVASHGEELVFVEVRTRRSHQFGSAEESVSAAKKERLIATAETYIQGLPQPPAQWRIDLVSVQIGEGGKIKEIRHLENAVELDYGTTKVTRP